MKLAYCLRMLLRFAIVACLLSTLGCLEEKDTLTVYPNGAGTIHLYKKFGEQLTSMILGFGGSGKQSNAVDDTLYQDLASWQGVTAWSPAKGTLEGGRISTDAIGYFDDISAVKIVQKDSAQTFAWSPKTGGGFHFVWNMGTVKDSLPSGMSDEQIAQANSMIGMFKDLKLERSVTMPGVIQDCDGCIKHTDRTGSYILTGDDIVHAFAKLQDYRKQIDSKQLTPEQADAAYKKDFKSLTFERLDITCAAGDAGKDFEQFKSDFAKAKKDYAASGIADKIKAAIAAKDSLSQ